MVNQIKELNNNDELKTPIITGKPTASIRKVQAILIILISLFIVIGLSELAFRIFVNEKHPLFPSPIDRARQAKKINDGDNLDDSTFSISSMPKESASSIDTETLNSILNTFEFLKEKDKASFLNEATVQYSISGVHVSGSEISEQYDDYTIVYYILLRGIEGKELKYGFTAKDLLNTKITRTASGNESEIFINEIKPGDTVTIKTIYGLLDTSEPIEIELKARETI